MESPTSPASAPKLPRHYTRKCGWICHVCRKVDRYKEKLIAQPCIHGRYAHDMEEYGWLCANCPCLSNDITTFLRSPCNEDFVKQRKAAKEKVLAEIREEAKRMEKIKLLQQLQEEREKLQNLLKRKQGCNLLQKNMFGEANM